MFSLVIVIPVYNHSQTIGLTVDMVIRRQLRCILVDDGSELGCAEVLDGIAALHPKAVTLVRLPHNQGKGAATVAGLRETSRQGYTHALQIDADGQHNLSDIPRFLELAKNNPRAVVCGCPIYDDLAPKTRIYARYLTHFWVWVNTLSFAIRDSMCGFRVYPLDSTIALIDSGTCKGRRMEFDSEVLVRLHWRGVSIINLPTLVTYPQDGISHFRQWRDNLLISRMHATLFFGMLRRLPGLFWRKVRAS